MCEGPEKFKMINYILKKFKNTITINIRNIYQVI